MRGLTVVDQPYWEKFSSDRVKRSTPTGFLRLLARIASLGKAPHRYFNVLPCPLPEEGRPLIAHTFSDPAVVVGSKLSRRPNTWIYAVEVR